MIKMFFSEINVECKLDKKRDRIINFSKIGEGRLQTGKKFEISSKSNKTKGK